MKCKSEEFRKLHKCGILNGEEWECWTELESLRQCRVIIVDAESLREFEEETETPEYKAKIDEIFKRIENSKKVRACNNVDNLKSWIGDDVGNYDIDDILEFLEDRGLLSCDGKMFRKEFWGRYIRRSS
jgi:hypothetical protein